MGSKYATIWFILPAILIGVIVMFMIFLWFDGDNGFITGAYTLISYVGIGACAYYMGLSVGQNSGAGSAEEKKNE
jgi:hypothetical protein